jgi:hypothetical protein
MRRIERTTQFKRDYKRKLKGKHRAALETTFIAHHTTGRRCATPEKAWKSNAGLGSRLPANRDRPPEAGLQCLDGVCS